MTTHAIHCFVTITAFKRFMNPPALIGVSCVVREWRSECGFPVLTGTLQSLDEVLNAGS